MTDISNFLHVLENENPYAEQIAAVHLAIDQDGEYFDDSGARIAFYRVALNDVMGDGAAYDATYSDTPYSDLGGKTPFETVCKDGPEGLKRVMAHLITHYTM